MWAKRWWYALRALRLTFACTFVCVCVRLVRCLGGAFGAYAENLLGYELWFLARNHIQTYILSDVVVVVVVVVVEHKLMVPTGTITFNAFELCWKCFLFLLFSYKCISYCILIGFKLCCNVSIWMLHTYTYTPAVPFDWASVCMLFSSHVFLLPFLGPFIFSSCPIRSARSLARSLCLSSLWLESCSSLSAPHAPYLLSPFENDALCVRILKIAFHICYVEIVCVRRLKSAHTHTHPLRITLHVRCFFGLSPSLSPSLSVFG